MENYLQYYYYLLPVTGVCFALFLVINLLYNPYKKDNKALIKCTKLLQKSNMPDELGKHLTQTYRFQWRLFQTSDAKRPSQVFSFYKHAFGTKFVVTYALSCTSVTLFALCGLHFHRFWPMLVYAIFTLASALVFVILARRKRKITQKSQRIFARFVVMLNQRFEKPIIDTAQKLDELKENLHDDTLEKASGVLRENGLESERTADEQRKVNVALNGLLQAYARSQTD